jgi:prepilin-type N-terminal cleavage/methylation domain-containing protein
MKQLSPKNSGFTLLELMLVLALVAILLVAGLAAYQIQVRNFKIDKTALQMQAWLQAGLAFYVDCNEWPNPANQSDIMLAMTGIDGHPITPAACSTLSQPVMKAYMPAGADSNGPWPNSYAIGVGSGAYANLFQVSTDLPFDNTNNPPGLQAIASSIAGRLPNATVVNDTSQKTPQIEIQTAIGIPGSALTNHGYILNMQIVNSNQVSNVLYPQANDCPKNMMPQVVSAPVNFSAPVTNNFDSVTTETPQSVRVNNQSFVEATLETYTHSFIFPSHTSKSGQLLVITACIPYPNNSISTTANNASSDAVVRF